MAKDDVVSVRELSSGNISEMSVVDARRAVGSGLYIVLDPTDEDWPDPNQPLPQLPYPGSDGEVLTSLDGEWQSKPMADVLGIEHAVPTIGEVLADGGPDAGDQVIENLGDASDDKDAVNLRTAKALPAKLTVSQDGDTVETQVAFLDVKAPQRVTRIGDNAVRITAGTVIWNALDLFPVGQIVHWRGGIWLAGTENRDSEPVSGNPDWSLIGGTPYVDVVLTPPEIGPSDSLLNTTGIHVFDAPGDGLLLVAPAVYDVVTPGDPWSDFLNLRLSYEDGESNLTTEFSVKAADPARPAHFALAAGVPLTFGPPETFPEIAIDDSPNDVNKGVLLKSSSGGLSDGSSSVILRIFYQILPAIPPGASRHFTITALNQSLKTFTVNGDASAVAGAVAVVGSTADDGDYTVTGHTHQDPESDAITACDHVAKTFTVAGDHSGAFPAGSSALVEGGTDKDGRYTVVSAVFGTDTVITVAESIADLTDTADGTIGHPEQTILAVTEAITSPTADGWVQVAA